MRGRGVHGAGARLQRDVLADDDGHVLADEGMLELQVFELRAGELRQHLALAEAVARQTGIEQLVGQHQQFRLPVARHPHHHVFDVRAQRHGFVGGQRPGRGGPDHQRHRVRARWLSKLMPMRRAKSAGSTTRNSTSTAGELLSSYSTSASASDERQSRHQ